MPGISAFLRHEWTRSAVLAMFIIGGLMFVFAVYQIASSSYQMGQNIAYQQQARGGEVDLQSQAQAQQLLAADLSLRELYQQRNTGIILAGAGLMVLAVAWIVRDAAAGARRAEANRKPEEGSARRVE